MWNDGSADPVPWTLRVERCDLTPGLFPSQFYSSEKPQKGCSEEEQTSKWDLLFFFFFFHSYPGVLCPPARAFVFDMSLLSQSFTTKNRSCRKWREFQFLITTAAFIVFHGTNFEWLTNLKRTRDSHKSARPGCGMNYPKIGSRASRLQVSD